MRLFGAVLVFVFFPVCDIGAEVPINGDLDSKFAIYAYNDIEIGQFVRARYGVGGSAEQFDHSWVKNIYGRLGVRYRPSDWLNIRTGYEVRVYFTSFPTGKQSDFTSGLGKYFSVYPHEIQGVVSIPAARGPLSMDLAVGYFPYKYNPEARNLGEFMFRSGTYPVHLINTFDVPYARLAGLRFSLGYKTELYGLQFDQLVLSESQMRPFFDVSLASILAFTILKNQPERQGVITAGAGISFSSLFSVDESLTTPENNKTMYLENVSGYDVDPVSQDTIWYGDTNYYTFRGIKVMARATIDPFTFVRGGSSFAAELLGEHGGKLYGELAILGLKNYPDNKKIAANPGNPYGYNKLNEKMPVLAGLNIPCWKILDVCAIELEFLDCPYPNDYEKIQQYGYPLPVELPDTADAYDPDTYMNDSWKWSVFLKKSFSGHFGMILQLSRDHQRWEWGPQSLNYDFEEALVKPREGGTMCEWAWQFKAEFSY